MIKCIRAIHNEKKIFKNWGFPKLHLCFVTNTGIAALNICNSDLKSSAILVSNQAPNSFVSLCLLCREYKLLRIDTSGGGVNFVALFLLSMDKLFPMAMK